ncbi:MAG: DUF4230 domain-containing protein [Lachnospiraceae bacterium]|nr:DUF4230 domain-containing protein [Lachnospiraceae bacterium]
MKKIFNIAVGIIAMILICCGVFLGTKYYYSKQIKEVEVVREVEKVVEKEIQISGETIRSSMANIGELCTAEYNYTHVEQVDSSREIKGFKIPFTTSMFIYSYDGTIKAGIDFTKIQIDKNDTKKLITVKLPDVKIISSEVHHDSFQLYDEKNNIFNPISVADVADSLVDLENSEKEKSIGDGLLDKAKTNAITLIENFMHGSYDVGEYDIIVVFN